MPSARGFGRSLGKQINGDVDKTSKGTGKRFGLGFGKGVAVLGGAVGIGAIIKQSSQLEQSFSKTMALVAASTGAPKSAMADLTKLAMKLGAETQFSANDASGAMLELGKAGISTSDIMGGALRGTLLLASAGGLELGTAATIASNAMNTFNLRGSDMNSIAAALAGGANASSASVESLGQALQQVGPGAKNAGLNLQETVGTLSAFDAAGIKGSDAGTSLKTMLTRLVPQTKKSADAMKDLGLNFINADGSFKSITNVAEQLKNKLGPLTEAQKTQALATIFGSDASRAASVLTNEGAKGLEKYIKATKDRNAAEKMSKAAMSGTAGAMERLRGSVETTELALGKALAPTITKVANGLSTKVLPRVTKFIDQMQSGKGAGGDFADTLGTVADALSGIGKAAGKIGGAFNALPSGVKKFAIEAGLALVVVSKLSKLTGGLSFGKGLGKSALGGLAGGLGKKAGVTPVFVTNMGAGGLPGGGKGGKGTTPVGGATGKGVKGSKGVGGLGLANTIGLAGALVTVGAAGNEVLPKLGGDIGKLDAALAKLNYRDPAAAASEFNKVLSKSNLSIDQQAQFFPKLTAAMEQTNGSNASLRNMLLGTTGTVTKFSGAIKSLPKAAQTEIKTKGLAPTRKAIVDLAAKYKLTPKQVRTLIREQGGTPTKKKVDGIIDSARTLGKLRPVAKVRADVHGKGEVDSLRASIAAVRSKSVTIETITRRRAAGNSSISGARALGGPVGRGKTYLVGERGPELFTAQQAGRITANNKLTSSGGGASGDAAGGFSGTLMVGEYEMQAWFESAYDGEQALR